MLMGFDLMKKGGECWGKEGGGEGGGSKKERNRLPAMGGGATVKKQHLSWRRLINGLLPAS